MDSKINNNEMREKIRNGLNLAFKRLIDFKRKNDGILVFSNRGKIVKVKAKNIKL